jgi:cellulose synthase (UDP-forming)
MSNQKSLPYSPNYQQMLSISNPKSLVYGGSGLLCILLAIGWLYSIHKENSVMLFFIGFMIFTMIPILTTTIGSLFVKSFDLKKHFNFIKKLHSEIIDVDVIVAMCGEDEVITHNTMQYVKKLVDFENYPVFQKYNVNVFICDDTKDEELANINKLNAESLNFNYIRRPNLGEHKKSGNLNYAVLNGFIKAKYFTIFDADFCPREDYLRHLIPYIEADDKISIVQTPQFFTAEGTNNLQKAAAYNQHLYYRIIQKFREKLGLTGCSGSCAVYRKEAIEKIGGFAKVECSEDVNTGLNTINEGYYIKYIPLILSMGVCPDTLQSFFTQQYRWALGGIELIFTKRLWGLKKLGLKKQLTFAFLNMFYVFNVLGVFLYPVLVCVGLWYAQGLVNPLSWMSLVFLYVFSYIIIPMWNNSKTGFFILPLTFMYSFIHVMAFKDFILNKKMEWIPSNAKLQKNKRFENYLRFLLFFPLIYFIIMFTIVLTNIENWNKMLPALMQCTFILVSCIMAFNLDSRGKYNLQTLIMSFKKDNN